jgi:hypothetical protein
MTTVIRATNARGIRKPFVCTKNEREISMTTAPSGHLDQFNWGTIELPPDLPLSVFTSMEPWHHERIGALALYCSDGRWGEAFDEFCHKHLQIPRYDRWAVPGGPAWLAASSDRGAFHQAAREQLDFLVRFHELEQVVLITHHGCAYYGHRLGKIPSECLQAQRDDVRTAMDTLHRWYPDIRVEAYLAMRNGRLLSFHRLAD